MQEVPFSDASNCRIGKNLHTGTIPIACPWQPAGLLAHTGASAEQAMRYVFGSLSRFIARMVLRYREGGIPTVDRKSS